MARRLAPGTELAVTALAAVGPFALPWVLAVVGWTVVSLDRPLEVLESSPSARVVTMVMASPPPPEPMFEESAPDVPERDEPGPEVEGADEGLDVGTDEADQVAGGGIEAPVAAGEGTEQAGDPAGAGKGLGKSLKRRRRGSSARCKKPHPNIRNRDDGAMELDRSMVHHYTHNLNEFLQLGVSGPYNEGDVRGWRIEGFGCTNPVYKAGFRKGDVLLTVNGKKVRTWPQVVLLYQKLKRKDAFEFELMRKGEPMTLQFVVNENG